MRIRPLRKHSDISGQNARSVLYQNLTHNLYFPARRFTRHRCFMAAEPGAARQRFAWVKFGHQSSEKRTLNTRLKCPV